ncbi:MAG: Stk1 family PASTA domain-containing Ser/Thr kinase [Eubacteriales bacterium]|nr:Stk1 family PASTA domain-containing Ser/Thr kinase [Eubacteriales bacterium]
MQSAQQHISKGFILDERYEVEEALGQGGMAYVYLARDLRTGRRVALKLMRDELSGDQEFIRRFATEARAAASLDHPNIVQVVDYGQDGDVRYIVQEFVNGNNLKEIILENGPLKWDVAVPLMIQIGLGLEHAHRRGIIHRDMKPQNVLITPEMTAKVTDFGIARAAIANTITLTGGMAFGSVHYFSPEQARGSKVTEASDLYSLGLMLYEMLTGSLPFDGESSVAVAIKQLQEMPARPSKLNPAIPPGLEAIIFKAIQKSPERRYQSAREFVNELDRFMVNPRAFQPSFAAQTQNWSSSSAALTTDKTDANYNKIEELERTIAKRRRSRLRDTLLVTLLVLAAVGGLAYLISTAVQRFNFDNRRLQSEDILVVDRYVGRQVAEVEAELKELFGDNYELIAVQSETQEKGIIFEQEPNYGTKLSKAEAHIKLKYSVGRSELTLRDVSNLDSDEAKTLLQQDGFNVVIYQEYSAELERGKVIRTEPQANSLVEEGSRIALYASRGSEQVMAPPLVGLTWDQAKEVLDELDLRIYGESRHYDAQNKKVDLPEYQRVILKQYTDAQTVMQRGSSMRVDYGTAEDYNKVQLGMQLGTTQPVQQLGQVILPDLSGMTAAEVKAALDPIWPSGAPRYLLSRSARLHDVTDEGAVVVNQSTPPGASFDPFTETLIISFDRY